MYSSHSFIHGLFTYFPQLFVLWQEYLSEMFCSFIYLRSSFCLLVFFFCCFTSSVLPDSCQGVQLLSSSKFHVSSKSVIQSKQIADLTNLGPPPVLPLWTTGNINLSEHLLFWIWDVGVLGFLFPLNFPHSSKFNCQYK